MKFATQHKRIKISKGGKEEHMTLHRNKKKVWATQGGGKTTVIFSRVFDYVSQAKAWMQSPDLRATP